MLKIIKAGFIEDLKIECVFNDKKIRLFYFKPFIENRFNGMM